MRAIRNRIIFFSLASWLPVLIIAGAQADSSQPVTVSEDTSSFTLSNSLVTARVSKRTGDLTSLVYKEMEILTDKSGHAGGYWSHDTSGGKETLTKITLNPAANEGERGEVSVKGISGGIKMGHGPGAAATGDFPADIEIRYALGRGDSGVYTYCVFEHLPSYPAATMTEARYCAKLADMFDWMTLDSKKDISFPASLKEGDKYIYTTVQYDHPVYGWSSTSKKTGFWLINPSMEYMSGGPTKVEFLCHRDTTPVAAPCLLNYWRSSHYGGAFVAVGEGEHWSKVIGPFFLYANSGADQQALFSDAQAKAVTESSKWPYNWVEGVDYPLSKDRAIVKGKLTLTDPLSTEIKPNSGIGSQPMKFSNLLIGLTHAAYESPVARPGPGPSRPIDWQTDAKHYEFWVRGDEQGQFAIPHVRPGKYTLHAMADGVLGEFARTDITVERSKSLDLGELTWTPDRRGRQIWEIGIPNRNGSEFFKGNEYANPSISLQYASLFPNDVNYVIGKSDHSKDWFFQHVPHNEDPNARVVPFSGVRGNGRATPFKISFEYPSATRGTATLRLAICGTSARAIDVKLNEQPIGTVDRLMTDGAIPRHSVQGLWYERELSFDAALIKQGTNVMELVIPAGSINNGIIYDYIRLELKEPTPGTTGNAENVPFIGKSDPKGNPVRLAKATGHVSNYSEEKVAPYTVPDPLLMFDGKPVTSKEMWFSQRRPEIMKFYQTEIYGRIPPTAPKVTWEVTETDSNARDGTAIMKKIVGRMGDAPDAPKLNLTMYVPAKVSAPSPVLLNLTFAFPPGARAGANAAAGTNTQATQAARPAAPPRVDPIEEVLGRGWVYVSLGYTDIQPDRADRWTEGVIGQTLSVGTTRPARDEWGTISAWAWGISRAIDYFETDKAVNPKQISITGTSRLGKTALWAGAQDERIAAVFSVVPGEMGASLIRRDWGETLDDMAQNFHYQFSGNMQKWIGKWNELPVDQHMLIAMCAPRLVYVNGGLTDQWSDPKGEFLAMDAAGPVYRLVGAKDLGVSELPPLDNPITGGDMAFHYHSAGHMSVAADWNAFLDFADRHFRQR